MPAAVILDSELGSRVIRRILFKHPTITIEWMAHVLGCSDRHLYKILSGKAPLTYCQTLGLAEKVGDPIAVLAPELIDQGLVVLKAPESIPAAELSKALIAVVDTIAGRVVTADDLGASLPAVARIEEACAALRREHETKALLKVLK